jgi:II/X family phage/plasmid replication protein
MPHDETIGGGHVFSIDSDGVEQWFTVKRASVRGSYDTGLQVRTATHTVNPRSHLEISGNPVKFFQGHNLWGTDDLPALALATCQAIAQHLNITITKETQAQWLAGDIKISRVDLTESFHLDNKAQVLAWLQAAEQSAHLSHRGRGQLVKGSTLYFGKGSTRWTLKLYSKGQEITAKGHGQDAILKLPHAVEWANKTLRAEVCIRGTELKRIGKEMLSGWLSADDGYVRVTTDYLLDKLKAMTMTTTRFLSAAQMETLKPALRAAVLAWESGADLRSIFPLRTFYRHRTDLLPYGIDIAALQPKEERSNVVPLHKTLEARPVSVPDWAIGTNLYFEPPRLVASN